MADDLKDNNTKTIEKEVKNKQVIESNSRTLKTVSYIGSHGVNIFSIIIIILISVTLIRFLYNGSQDLVSFSGLLEVLRDAPQVSDNVKNFVMQIGFPEPWSILDGFRIFLNNLLSFWSILIWLCSSLVDVVLFLIYFLKWIFI